MIHYTCDVCGSPLPDGYERPRNRNGNRLQNACGTEDVCSECVRVGAHLDVSAVLMAAWRELVEQGPSEATAPEPSSGQTEEERIRREKQRIHNRLKAYRDAHGLGSLEAVARQMRGKEYTSVFLLDVVNGTTPLDISVWRKIGKALDKLEGADEQKA